MGRIPEVRVSPCCGPAVGEGWRDRPTSMSGSVMPFEPLSGAVRGRRRPSRARPPCACSDCLRQRDLFSVGKMYVGQFFEHLRVRRRGAAVVAFPTIAIKSLAARDAEARLHAVLRIGDGQQLPNRSGQQRPLRHCEEPLRRRIHGPSIAAGRVANRLRSNSLWRLPMSLDPHEETAAIQTHIGAISSRWN